MASIIEKVSECRRQFNSGITIPEQWRRKQLLGLRKFLIYEEEAIVKALLEDKKKNHYEIMVHEYGISMNEIITALNGLKKWMKKDFISKSLMTILDTGYTLPQPFGVVLIISAWNYPVNLIIQPLVGAISAGNTAILKPSEMSPAVSNMLAELLPRYIDPKCFQFVEGGVQETTELLTQRFDKILYTGSTAVGRIVMAAAAKHLTPCILELGGKAPVYVADDANLDIAARRICWAKFLNAGQICINIDYVMCSKSVKAKLIPLFKKTLEEYYGTNPDEDNKICRIINKHHFDRIMALAEDTTVLVGDRNRIDSSDLYIPPLIVDEVGPNHPLSKNEIFGPLLYFRCVDSVQQGIDLVNQGEKPLALYVFSSSDETCERFVNKTYAGGVTCNDIAIHGSVTELPFGGVGNSGMGCYHGKHSFDSFSHMKPVLKKNKGWESLNELRSAPYSEKKQSWVMWFMIQKLSREGRTGSRWWPNGTCTVSVIAILAVASYMMLSWI